MKCHEARRLFGACWDDETTQAERDWLDAHFAACPGCRREYEDFARAVEAVSTLPRHEAAPDLLERTLARTRRAAPAHDTLPQRRPAWVSATAAAAVLVVTATLVTQWVGLERPGSRSDRVATVEQSPVAPDGSSEPNGSTNSPVAVIEAPTSSVPDSIFDHGDDIEFVLDPVTLKRGRAAVTRQGPGEIRTEQAVVSF